MLLDANIIIEFFFQRSLHTKVANILTKNAPVESKTSISVLSVTFFMYHVEKQNKSLVEAYDFLDKFEILDINSADYAWAKDNDQGDFEDSLQVACALRHGRTRLLTLDKLLAKNHNKHIAVELVS